MIGLFISFILPVYPDYGKIYTCLSSSAISEMLFFVFYKNKSLFYIIRFDFSDRGSYIPYNASPEDRNGILHIFQEEVFQG